MQGDERQSQSRGRCRPNSSLRIIWCALSDYTHSYLRGDAVTEPLIKKVLCLSRLSVRSAPELSRYLHRGNKAAATLPGTVFSFRHPITSHSPCAQHFKATGAVQGSAAIELHRSRVYAEQLRIPLQNRHSYHTATCAQRCKAEQQQSRKSKVAQ
jgi:hypothetical protein